MWQPGVHPGECWAFNGSEGYLVVQLSSAIAVTEVSIEHIPVSLAPTGSIDSAPRDFTVWVSCSLPYLSLSLPLYPSLYFNSHFSRWTWLSDFTSMSPFWISLELRMMEVVVTTGAIGHVKLQSNKPNKVKNISSFTAFYRPDTLCHPANSVKLLFVFCKWITFIQVYYYYLHQGACFCLYLLCLSAG